MSKQRICICLIFLIVLGMGSSLAWRMRPIMGQKECYNHFFPSRSFVTKIESPVPEWMTQQLNADFQDVPPITVTSLEKVYKTIMGRIQEPIFLYHYRILDNQLYKYVPSRGHWSDRDTYYEKAFKTLLSHTSLPDLDFILCPMDGIPEAIMAPDFYLMDDSRDQVPILGQAKLKPPLTRLIVLIPDQLSLSEQWYRISEEILQLNRQIPWSIKTDKCPFFADRKQYERPHRKDSMGKIT